MKDTIPGEIITKINSSIKDKKYEQTIKIIEKIINDYKNNYYLYVNLGACYSSLNMHDKALEAYNNALKIKEDDEFLFSNLGNLMLEKKNYEESIKLYKQGLLINQNSMSCQIGLASVYTRIQNYEEAHKIYLSLFKNEAINYNVIIGLGICLLYLKQFEKALPFIQKAVELNPNDRNAIKSLSTIYHHLGKKNEAVKYTNKADGVIVFNDDEEEYQII